MSQHDARLEQAARSMTDFVHRVKSDLGSMVSKAKESEWWWEMRRHQGLAMHLEFKPSSGRRRLYGVTFTWAQKPTPIMWMNGQVDFMQPWPEEWRQTLPSFDVVRAAVADELCETEQWARQHVHFDGSTLTVDGAFDGRRLSEKLRQYHIAVVASL